MHRDMKPSPFSFSAPGLTFCEAKDCVQWYKTSLSLLKGLDSAVGSSHSSPSATLPSSSMAEMGHQLQLVGVTWLEDAMTERFVRVEERSGARRDGGDGCTQREERKRERETERERGRGGRGGGGRMSAARAQHHLSTRRQHQSAPVLKSASPPATNPHRLIRMQTASQ